MQVDPAATRSSPERDMIFGYVAASARVCTFAAVTRRRVDTHGANQGPARRPDRRCRPRVFRKIALLVGVAEYPNYSQIGKLAYPSNDVALIGELLRAQGYTVIRLADGQATREAVRGAMRNIGEVFDQRRRETS